jgi:hypothetical protein
VILPYKYTVADAVLELFAVSPRRQREELLRIFAFLSREPFTQGETTNPTVLEGAARSSVLETG